MPGGTTGGWDDFRRPIITARHYAPDNHNYVSLPVETLTARGFRQSLNMQPSDNPAGPAIFGALYAVSRFGFSPIASRTYRVRMCRING